MSMGGLTIRSLLTSRMRYAAFSYLATGVVVAATATSVLVTAPVANEVRQALDTARQSVGQTLSPAPRQPTSLPLPGVPLPVRAAVPAPPLAAVPAVQLAPSAPFRRVAAAPSGAAAASSAGVAAQHPAGAAHSAAPVQAASSAGPVVPATATVVPVPQLALEMPAPQTVQPGQDFGQLAALQMSVNETALQRFTRLEVGGAKSLGGRGHDEDESGRRPSRFRANELFAVQLVPALAEPQPAANPLPAANPQPVANLQAVANLQPAAKSQPLTKPQAAAKPQPVTKPQAAAKPQPVTKPQALAKPQVPTAYGRPLARPARGRR